MLLRHPYANLELFCSLTQQLGAAPTGAAMLGGAAGPGTPPRGLNAPRPDGGFGGAGRGPPAGPARPRRLQLPGSRLQLLGQRYCQMARLYEFLLKVHCPKWLLELFCGISADVLIV